MNTLILDREITPADVLREREVRAKVLYSPCQDNDIKWKYCSCFVCRAVWDPTGEEDARFANAQRQNRVVVADPEEDPIPTSLPPAKDSDKTVTLTGSEVNTALRLLGNFESLLDRCIEKLTTRHEERSKALDSLPPPPPELDELFSTKTQVMNLIQDLSQKLMM